MDIVKRKHRSKIIKLPIKLILFFVILIFNISVLNAQVGKKIYVSSSTGIDSCSTGAENLVIKTLGYLQCLAENNDSIFFKKGDVWKGENWYSNKSNLYVGVYGEGELPIITNRNTIDSAMDSSNWEFVDDRWRVFVGYSPARLFLDGEEKLRALNLFNLGVPDSQNKTGIWFVESNYLYIDSDDNPTLEYGLFEGSSKAFTFIFEGTSNCHLDSLKLEGGNAYSLWLSNSDSTTIKHCEFGKDGRGGISLSNGSDYNLIDSVIVDSHYSEYYGYAFSGPEDTDRGVGDGINLNNDASYNTISNSTFKNWSHNALEIVHNYPSNIADSTNHNKFINLDIDASDIPYGHPFGADGPQDRCSFNEWRNITANNCKTAIQVNGNHNHVHNSTLSNFKQSPAKSSISATAIWCAVYEGTSDTSKYVYNVSEDNLFENLLIYNTDESAIRIEDFDYEDRAVHNITFRNCLIFNPGLNPINGDYNMGTAIYFEDAGTIDSIVFEGNLIYQDSLAVEESVYLSTSGQYLDFDTFNVLNFEFGVGSCENLNLDPDLIGFEPSDSSAVINAGINAKTQPNTDILDSPRVVDGRIDIGPFENQNLCNDRAIRYIDEDAIGAETGTSWQDAYTTIYDAISECVDGENRAFWVAEGKYYPTASTDRSIAISLPSATTLFGGWQGDEYTLKDRNYALYPTILSGDIGVQNFAEDNSFHVLQQDQDSLIIIDGVTIQDGFGGNQGGGINIQNTNLELVNLIIQDNEAVEADQLYVKNSEILIDSVTIVESNPIAFDVIFDHLSKVIIVNSLQTIKVKIRGDVEIEGIIDGIE